MKRRAKWIPKSVVLAIHERLLAEHGGAGGLVNEGLLDSALARPQNHLAYEDPDIFQLAAIYAHALTRNHPFRDGNKRVALTIAGTFLEINGFRLDASEADAVVATIALSTGALDEQGFASWLRDSFSPIPDRRRTVVARRTPRSNGKNRKKK